MAIYHVDTQAQFKKASSLKLQPGDQVLLKRGRRFSGGLHPQGRASAWSPILIGAYGQGPRPRIDGGKRHAISSSKPISGWAIQGLELTSDNSLNGEKRITGGTCGVYFKQEELCDGLSVRDCLIHHTSGPGIYLVGQGPAKAVFKDVALERLRIHHNSCGIQFAGYPHFYTEYVSGYRIADVVAHEIGGDGIVPFCSNSGLVEYCSAYRTGLGVHPKDHSPVAIWFAWVRDSVIQHCEAWDNHTGGLKGDGGGFDIDGGCTRCVLQYNYSHDNDGAGYLLCSWDPKRWPSTDCDCRFNISVNDGLANDYPGILFWQADHFRVYNNSVATRKASGLKFVSPTRGHWIANNIFSIEAPTRYPMLKSAFPIDKNRFEKNLWWHAGGRPWMDLTGKKAPGLKRLLAGAKTRGEKLADPRFKSLRLDDLHAGAKMRGAALPEPAPYDFYGNKVDAKKPWVGAAQGPLNTPRVGSRVWLEEGVR